MRDTAAKRTPAWVLHPALRGGRDARPAGPALEEAVALAAALPGLDLRGAEVVPLARPHPGMLFGSGKVAELKARFAEAGVELVLVDGPVSPVQQRNLEKEWGTKLLDRTGLILEIFADRARTREGVLQVEMAALSYQRTRLVRSWTHLERQRGGFGFVGGPGETQIEADRRAIDDQLVKLRRQLDRVSRTRTLHRAARAKVPFPVVALVGYTNAGKSTLFNRLTGSDVLAKDMLFATLDPTMRRVRLPAGLDVILSDTVGFISNLPTELVAAFRATLEEVLDADLILHVRDIAHPQSEAQARDVEAILASLGVAESTPLIEVWNKIDLLPEEMRDRIAIRSGREPAVFPVSALTGEGIAPLLSAVAARLDDPRSEEDLFLPHAEGRLRAWLHDQGVVLGEEEAEGGTHLRIRWTARQRDRYRALQAATRRSRAEDG
ncbi:GTP-binding protein HflX [Rubellimicrobium thermophilum DSM 16684]|uniref:GTPase HflX n=1 Tax=Rubellimicrobium thermophilum DSM 16684 TaxID=1123069 RepID=S9S7K4_9RHOB|nr:GTPase HflX [Rubellimicrobium thermophilum]EPX86160.1 GTP-binding protein HflX [Rubellimicrobium thermophilum DSM 16684]